MSESIVMPLWEPSRLRLDAWPRTPEEWLGGARWPKKRGNVELHWGRVARKTGGVCVVNSRERCIGRERERRDTKGCGEDKRLGGRNGPRVPERAAAGLQLSCWWLRWGFRGPPWGGRSNIHSKRISWIDPAQRTSRRSSLGRFVYLDDFHREFIEYSASVKIWSISK